MELYHLLMSFDQVVFYMFSSILCDCVEMTLGLGVISLLGVNKLSSLGKGRNLFCVFSSLG